MFSAFLRLCLYQVKVILHQCNIVFITWLYYTPGLLDCVLVDNDSLLNMLKKIFLIFRDQIVLDHVLFCIPITVSLICPKPAEFLKWNNPPSIFGTNHYNFQGYQCENFKLVSQHCIAWSDCTSFHLKQSIYTAGWPTSKSLLDFPKLIFDSSKSGQWTSPFKKFSRIIFNKCRNLRRLF